MQQSKNDCKHFFKKNHLNVLNEQSELFVDKERRKNLDKKTETKKKSIKINKKKLKSCVVVVLYKVFGSSAAIFLRRCSRLQQIQWNIVRICDPEHISDVLRLSYHTPCIFYIYSNQYTNIHNWMRGQLFHYI